MLIDYAIALPWPDKALNPNARLHWAGKYRANKRAKETAYWLTRDAIGYRFPEPIGKISVRTQFFPPNKRRRDGDNCNSMMKGSYDGIAQALGVDDSRFVISYELMEEPGNKVLVFLSFEAHN